MMMKNRRSPPPPSPLRRVETAVRLDPAALKNAKQRYLMETFCDTLCYRIREEMETANFNTIALIGSFTSPTPENRERDIYSCYWAGRYNIRTEGTPIVHLLQGVRDDSGQVRPDWLWGGQTAIDNMNEFFGADGWLIYNHYNVESKEFQIFLIDCRSPTWEEELETLKMMSRRRRADDEGATAKKVRK